MPYKTTHYNTLNVKVSNSQPNKLESGIKNATEVTLHLSSNVVAESNGETKLSHKLLLIDTEFSRLCKGFTSNLSANKKISKGQLSNMIQLVGFSLMNFF